MLPWSQLSYWATTVATNAFGSIPIIGEKLVIWVRGIPKVNQYTLGRFFSMHVSFIPFTILVLIVIHLLFMRLTGISAQPGSNKNGAKVPFLPHVVTKDLVSIFIFLAVLTFLIFYFPQIALPYDSLIPANPLETPSHIKPEWYFLANYQILKVVPNEFLGILSQVAVGTILFFLPFDNGISCNDCHGGNLRVEGPEEAMNPKERFLESPKPEEIPDFCGKCHSAVKDNYMASVRFKALLKGDEGSHCVTCHTVHQQKKVTIMEKRVDQIFREGLDIESEKKALFALRNRTH